MSRTKIIVLNLILWTLGIGTLWLFNLGLARWTAPGLLRSVLYFLAVGLVVTIFGGTYGLLKSRDGKSRGSGL